MPDASHEADPPAASRRLGGKGLLDANATRGELARRMKIVAQRLSRLKQDDRAPDMDETAKALVNSKILESADKDVRLYAATCLADILRIYAPDAPYPSPVLLQVFSLIISQLRGLSSLTGSRAESVSIDNPVRYLLHNIATVKSCIIMSELLQQGLPRAEEELVELFSCLLNSCREDHSAEVREQVLSILTATVDELEVVPEALVDAVLLCFTVEAKRDRPATFAAAQVFVSQAFEKLHAHISTLLKQVLTGRAAGASEEVEEEVLHIIYELQRVNPSIMVHLFPHVATQLQAEDPSVRSRAVALLGRLFAATHAEYGEDYQRIFREFLGRFVDKEGAIRSQMVSIGGFTVGRKPKLADSIVPLLAKRLEDPEWEIRAKATKELCDVALRSLELIPTDVCLLLSDSVRDKRPSIRQESIARLAELYYSYISRHLVEDEEHGASSLAPDVTDKLGWIPGRLLQVYAIHDCKIHVLQALEDVILPVKASCAARTNVLVFIWNGLEAKERQCLRRVLFDKAMVHHRVHALLQARAAHRQDPDNEAKEVELQRAESSLLEVVPPTDKKHAKGLFEKLRKTKDQNVPKLLKALVDPCTSLSSLAKARDELVAKMGSKTPLGDYLQVLSRRGSVVVGNAETFTHLITHARTALEDEDDDDDPQSSAAVCSSVDLMELFIDALPAVLQGAKSSLLELCWSASKHDATQTRVLRILARAKIDSPSSSSKGSSSSKAQQQHDDKALHRFKQEVTKLCLRDGSAKASRLGLLALCNLLLTHPFEGRAAADDEQEEEEDPVFAKILKELAGSKSLVPDNARIEAVLRCLAVYAERLPRLFEHYSDSVRVFLLHKLLRPGEEGSSPPVFPTIKSRGRGKNNKGHADRLSAECRRTVAALKLLVAHVLGLRARQPDGEEEAGPSQDADASVASAAGTRRKSQSAEARLGSQDKVSVSREALEATAAEVLDLLYQVLEADGDSPDGCSLNKQDRARVRLVCAAGILKLMRHRQLEHRLMTTQRWRALAWVMLDSDPAVTAAFSMKLATAVSTNKVHMKFFAMLSLTANDPSHEVQKHVQEAVTRAVVKLRRAYEQYMMKNEARLSDDDKRKVTTAMMPEYVLPYMLHLLAHHPDFPASPDDAPRRKQLERCLGFLLDPLMHTLGHEADNLSFLIQMCDMIVSTPYRDASAPSSTTAKNRLHTVAKLCRQYLTSKIKIQENLQAFPGKIYLPLLLYERDRASSGRGSLTSPVAAEAGSGEGLLPDWGSPIQRHAPDTSRRGSTFGSGGGSAKAARKSAGVKRRARARKNADSDDDEEEDDEDRDDVFGSVGDVSVSKDAAQQKTKTRRSPQQDKAAGRKKGRAKADEEDEEEDMFGFPDDDEEEAAGDEQGEGDEEKSLKLSAEEQKQAREERAAKRTTARGGRGGDSSSGTAKPAPAARRGGRRGAAAREEEKGEKVETKPAAAPPTTKGRQTRKGQQQQMPQPPAPSQASSVSASSSDAPVAMEQQQQQAEDDEESLALSITQNSVASYFTAGGSVVSLVAPNKTQEEEEEEEVKGPGGTAMEEDLNSPEEKEEEEEKQKPQKGRGKAATARPQRKRKAAEAPQPQAGDEEEEERQARRRRALRALD